MGSVVTTNWYIYRVYTPIKSESEANSDKTLEKKKRREEQ